jgi:Ca-activated chloride channel family protein
MQKGTPDPKLKEDIIQVALSYGLMSQFTSFVAVEEKIVNEGGQQKKVAVPVEMPDGVSYEGIFGDKAEEKSKASYGFASGSYKVSPSVAWNGSVSVASQVAAPPSPGGAHVTGMISVDAAVDTDARLVKRDDGKPMSAEQNKQLIESKLDAILRALPAKMKTNSSGNLKEAGKFEVQAGKVRVAIKISELSDANLAKLKALGVKVTSSSQSLAMVIGWAPVDKLEELALSDFVLKITPAT